jgi:hypothetical protein
MEVSGQLHAQAILPQGKRPWYPLDRKVGGPQSRCERGDEEKNSQLLPVFEPPIIRLEAQRYSTELSRLLQINEGINEYMYDLALCNYLLIIKEYEELFLVY